MLVITALVKLEFVAVVSTVLGEKKIFKTAVDLQALRAPLE